MMQLVAYHGTWAVDVDATMWHDYLGKCFTLQFIFSTSLLGNVCIYLCPHWFKCSVSNKVMKLKVLLHLKI